MGNSIARFSVVLVEGCRWRAVPGDFPAWQTVYTYFRNWRLDGTWMLIHDRLREWTRIEQERHASPTDAIIDSQSVKRAAGVHESIGFDKGKLIKGRKRQLKCGYLGVRMRGCSSQQPMWGSVKAANESSSESNAWAKHPPG